MSEATNSSKLGVSKHYTGEAGERYFEYQKTIGRASAQIEVRKFRPFVSASDVVLDFGCGTGAILNQLQASQKIGIEPNPAARAFTAEHFPDVRSFPSIEDVSNETISVAISNHCLEHVPHPTEVLRHILRVLKPGGRLVVYLPIDDWRTQRHYEASDINHHLHTWTPLLFGHTLADAGFTDIETGVVTHALPPRFATLYKMFPMPIFSFTCYCMAIVAKRRQLCATARRPARNA